MSSSWVPTFPITLIASRSLPGSGSASWKRTIATIIPMPRCRIPILIVAGFLSRLPRYTYSYMMPQSQAESQVRTGLYAGGKWIRTSGSARDCIMVEVRSRASPGQSSSPAARPRLERAANGGSLGFAPGRDPAASPERAHRIPAKRCFRTRCVSTDLSPGPHTRGKTRALPPCFYRRHRAHFPSSLTGRFDLRVGTPACPGPLTAAIPDRLSRPTIMLSGFAPGSRIARDFGGNR